MSMTRMICRFLIVTMALLPFQTVQAGMIGTDQVASVATAQSDRAAVLNIISRAEVASQLQALGIDLNSAKSRIAAMTDEEVHALSGKLDSLPAGAKTSGWAWAVVIALVIWAFYAWK